MGLVRGIAISTYEVDVALLLRNERHTVRLRVAVDAEHDDVVGSQAHFDVACSLDDQLLFRYMGDDDVQPRVRNRVTGTLLVHHSRIYEVARLFGVSPNSSFANGHVTRKCALSEAASSKA